MAQQLQKRFALRRLEVLRVMRVHPGGAPQVCLMRLGQCRSLTRAVQIRSRDYHAPNAGVHRSLQHRLTVGREARMG
jgi:hypothetical protein